MTRTSRRSRRPARRREGAVAVLVVIAMIALLGVASIAVDVSHVYKVRTELQFVADASAHAAATRLDSTADGINAAIAQAKTTGAANEAYGSAVTIRDEDIEFGTWDNTAETFTAVASPADSPTVINGVRVRARMDNTGGTPVTAAFGALIGHPNTEVSGAATAIAGGPAKECAFPMVVPQCQLSGVAGESCEWCFQFSNNNNDTAGWSSLQPKGPGDGANVGVGTIADLIRAGCFTPDGVPAIDATTGECIGACTETPVDGMVQLNNGVGILGAGNGNGNDNGGNGNSGNGGDNGGGNDKEEDFDKKGPCELIENILTRNGAPEKFTIKVPTLDSSNVANCADFNFPNEGKIVGFAEVEIFGVSCGGGATPTMDANYVSDGNAGDCGVPNDVYVYGALNCDASSNGVPGGPPLPNTIETTRIRLVQ